MANRPVFIPLLKPPYYKAVGVEFIFNAGFSTSQKQKNVIALHDGFRKLYSKEPLEISSKSMQDGGIKLSAFNLKKYIVSIDAHVPVECAYQGGKVFKNGGPYKELFMMSAREAKHDERLKNSGPLIGFEFENQYFGLKPESLYYDYLWINALLENPELAEIVLQYEAFTDIEFNPNKQISCQAKAAAVFVALHKLNKLESLKSADSFYELLTNMKPEKRVLETNGQNLTEESKTTAVVVKEATNLKETVKIKVGDIVKHSKFGNGTVIKDINNMLEIDFHELQSIKKLGKDWVLKNCKINQ